MLRQESKDQVVPSRSEKTRRRAGALDYQILRASHSEFALDFDAAFGEYNLLAAVSTAWSRISCTETPEPEITAVAMRTAQCMIDSVW